MLSRHNDIKHTVEEWAGMESSTWNLCQAAGFTKLIHLKKGSIFTIPFQSTICTEYRKVRICKWQTWRKVYFRHISWFRLCFHAMGHNTGRLSENQLLILWAPLGSGVCWNPESQSSPAASNHIYSSLLAIHFMSLLWHEKLWNHWPWTIHFSVKQYWSWCV